MIEATIIGSILNAPKDTKLNGKPAIEFCVRCENSPRDKIGSTFDFKIVTTNMGLREKLVVGAEIYASGLLKIGLSEGRIQANMYGLVFNLLERRRSVEDIKMEILTQTIPLESI